MKKLNKLIILLSLLVFCINTIAKEKEQYYSADRIMSRIPDSLTYSTQDLADFINTNLDTQKDKARAIFYWIADNVEYDIINKNNISIENDYILTNDSFLKLRKGVCMDYVRLFNEIAAKVGIKTYSVNGYNKQNGEISYNLHSWCACYIDSTWCFIDPTWGAGHEKDKVFIKEINNKYFMAEPKYLIKTHIPIDPLWQLIDYPITKQEFETGKSKANKNRAFFNLSDSLKLYENQTEIARLESSFRRIKKNGIANYIDYGSLVDLKNQIKFHYNSINEDIYETAVAKFDEGVLSFNKYIYYQNKYYLPYKSDQDINQMLLDTESIINHSIKILDSIKNPNENLNQAIIRFKTGINVIISELNTSKEKLEKYLEIAKNYRESLSKGE